MSLTAADLLALWVQVAGTLLFCMVFVFLWRQSGIVYFGLWAAAWGAQSIALVSATAWLGNGSGLALTFYSVLQFTFAVLLVAAARAGFSRSIHDWKGALKLLIGFPFYITLLLILNWREHIAGFHALHAGLVGVVYIFNFTNIRGPGLGGRLFRFALLFLAAVFFYQAAVFGYMERTGALPPWLAHVEYGPYCDLALNGLLTFAAMAMWIESQRDRVRELGAELDRVRRETLATLDLDRLTGLLNQSALSKRMEEGAPFDGVVAVCDMDDFKEVNDRYGHLVGDEILRAVGHLLRTSIRPADDAFRWGGDEFVVLFHNQDREVAHRRMQEIAERLRGFRVRGHGILPISFSWGTAEGGRLLREVLDEADRNMYGFKRGRR
ncbi:MAG TPA: GGDEF domain-containing protein [Bryobacteraceae bacterium]|nr:GGDEF domain-containing protein [Bryobacteraceae bacterium]